MDYALIWNTTTSVYDIYHMGDAKTQLYRLGTIHPDDIDVTDINERIAHDWNVEKHGTG